MLLIKVFFGIILLHLPYLSSCCTEYYVKSTKESYRYWCGAWKAFRCTGYRSVTSLENKCCEGWDGDGCLIPLCNGNNDPDTSCSLNEGWVVERNGREHKSSGGKCVGYDQCDDCNPGYYSTGPNCAACTTIENCPHASCTNNEDSECVYCDGEVRENQYGWYAYTRFYSGDEKTKCRKACSWRPGSRCYPGSCPDTTTESCQCLQGLSGPDCDTITEYPQILQNFLRLTETTTTSANHVDAPSDSGSGSPQERIWTNNNGLKRFSGYVDASYKKTLPQLPSDDFYVNLEGTKLGVIDSGMKLELIRGQVKVEATILKNCKTEPTPIDYRCEFDGTFSEGAWPVPFEEGDILRFTAFATNGGYVSIYNRENNDQVDRYDITGKSKENEFEVWFDVNTPKHCVMEDPDCSSQPLVLQDITTEPTTLVTWHGWEDTLSGIESYHFEVFPLTPTGSDNEMIQGDKVEDAVPDKVPATVSETTVTLPSPGPYAITITAYDIVGNHKTARRLVIFDDNSAVTLEGSRNVQADIDGSCIWSATPSAPIVKNADPKTNCDWITKPSSVINIKWKDRFINQKHHNRQWLNPVRSVAGIDKALDDNDGVRTTAKIDNVQGIVAFQVAYTVTFEEKTTTYPFVYVDDIHAESFSFDLDIKDGMKIDVQVRATDVFGVFVDDYTRVKVDTSAPIIEDFMLVRGDILKVAVHNVDDLTQLQFEWKAYDFHSGIEEVYWRVFDNYTGAEIDHGTSYMPPQAEETQESCRSSFSDYPRGADCYCTPFNNCFHRHFQVTPQIHKSGTNGLHPSKYLGVHDADYFIEVAVTNKAMLKTTNHLKVTIDTSPPVAGSVHEGIRGEPDMDYQQHKTIQVYWSDFFDKESGIKFYRYGYGTECLEASDFDMNSTKLHETLMTEASFTVENEGKYFVTVAAYNHALDHSMPVCSDGIVIDTSVPIVFEFSVEGAKVEPRLLREMEDSLWVLHEDRTRQKLQTESEICKSESISVSNEDLQMIPQRRNNKGATESIILAENEDCTHYISVSGVIISFVHDWKYLYLYWNTTGSKSGVYDFEVGISSSESAFPDMVDFKSSNHQTQLTLSHPNLNEGSLFYFIIKSVSRSGIENMQTIGPFMLLTMPPTFDTEITVAYQHGNDRSYLVASWTDVAGQEGFDTMKLSYQYAIGSHKYGTDVHPFTSLAFFGNCVSTNPPRCTAILLNDLDWNIHHGEEYYITIRVNSSLGLTAKVSSKPYKHEILKPSAGVVIDTDPRKSDVVSDNYDIDYQKSTTEMTARWYGFDHFYAPIHYTACITDAQNAILPETCKYVGGDKTTTLTGAQLTTFQKYKVIVKAETDIGTTSAYSDGIIVIDNNVRLDDINIFDGEPCAGKIDIMPKEKSHHNTGISLPCSQAYQASLQSLTAYWIIPEEWKPFVPDLYWYIEERDPVVEYWTSKTEQIHLSSATGKIGTNFPLAPGRTYRFGLKFCAEDICYNAVYTSGVTVVPSPPKAGQLTVSYSSDTRKVLVMFEKFHDQDIEDLTKAQDVMDYYEWNIADNDVRGRVLRKWTRLQDIKTANETHLTFETILGADITFTKCWNFLLRGTNKVGSSSIVAKNIKPCDDLDSVKPATVIDCVGLPKETKDRKARITGSPIELGVNERWLEDDKDYTPYNNILSAVWPDLRYNRYEWAVIEIHSNDPVLYYSETPALRNPCDSPEAVSCGTTDKNYVNVFFDAEPLLNGHRYIICIHADSEVLEHEYWNEELPEISSCSDGLTVDTTPPQPGHVWIYRTDALYQYSKSEVTIYWERFIDIEELGRHVHESGMSHYEVSLGSFPEGADVVSLTNVGIVNHVTFHDLKLQDGHSYYGTVKGYDFTGRHSSVNSAPVIVDTTPPEKSSKEITMKSRFITELSHIEACWTGVFKDPESGMAHYKWAVGSRPGYDNIYTFEETYDTCSETKHDYSLTPEEGHSYFVTVMGFNNAGLFITASSWAFTVDTSPPITGYVNDGKRKQDGSAKDIDYQTERSELSAHWGGFSDPHTPIKEFILSIGTTRGGTDVIIAQSVGVVNDITVDHLQLREGSPYYVSITACNTAGLCTSEVSDGVLVDSSHPVPGKVVDGTGNKDIRYQASRNYIGAKWFGFTDPQSGLSHFTWRVGTAPLADDLVPAREVHLHEIATIPDLTRDMNIKLPVNKIIYNTIRAYNKAGLYIESVSNGFIVADSAPVFRTPLQHVSIGSLLPLTSVLRSSLKVKWDVVDPVSYITAQYLSIAAHRGDNFNETVKIGGFVRDYIFTNLILHDGSLYSVKLTACNGAKLCSSSVLPDLLVDTSPPNAGTFAIHTDHAVSRKLNRQPDNWMTWESNQINLAWLGFSDIHSGILEYQVNTGSSFMADDLNENPGQPYVVAQAAFDQEDGAVQTNTIKTGVLLDYEHIFISIWTINGVGLKSEIVHSQFRLVPGGSMQLIRRCESHTCQGHCVCAAQDLKCTSDAETQDCIDKSGDVAYAIVEVEDVIYLSGDVDDSFEGTHTPTDMMLSAKWSPKSGIPPVWYEWSVGHSQYDSPVGVFDSHARVWHDAGRLLLWTFTLPKGDKLLEGEQYSFFIRAWFNSNTFSTFKSRGVIIQTRAPETTALFGKTVKEVHENSDKDIDYIKASDRLSAMWDGKFKNTETSTFRYGLFISSEPNGHDIYTSNGDIPPHTTKYNLTGLYPDTDTRFYANVVAYNQAGLHTVATSDGCEIDDDKPVAGVVYDGKGFLDIKYQNTPRIVSASWQGFVDLGSSLRSYYWCTSPADDIGSCSVLPRERIGLVTRAERNLPSAIPNGLKIINEVYATDLIGHVSDTVVSDGIVVDETPPVRLYHLSFGENLLTNPSFEDTSTSTTIDELTLTQSCLFDSPQDWILAEDSCGITVTARADLVHDGTKFLVLKGSILQTVTGLNRDSVYSLTFYTSHVPTDNSTRSNSEGFVSFDGEKHLIMLYSKPNRSDHGQFQMSWHFHKFSFKPSDSEVKIEIGAFENSVGIAVDNVQLKESIVTNDKDNNAEGHVRAHTVFLHDWSSVHALWNFIDDESEIQEYLWAIGTVQGGIQLQDFKSVGTRLFDTNRDLYLPHNITIHISVVAVNGAGLRTISYSDPVRVDLTPPEFEYVNDGIQEGIDGDYQTSLTVGVNFKVSDPESGIGHCSWGIGTKPGDISIQEFETLPSSQYSSKKQLQEQTSVTKIFVVVRCKNEAGLVSTMSSDGIAILKDKPSADNIVVEVLGKSPSQYLAHSYYHGTRDSLRIRWTANEEDGWIQKYKVVVKGPSHAITSYVHEYSPGYTYATFLDLPFEDGLYNISVTGIDHLNTESDTVSTSVTVLTEQPKIKGEIQISWNSSLEEVKVTWSDVFLSASPLYYEVSAGRVKGGGDIMQWQETRNTELIFKLARNDIGQYGNTIYSVVRAITLSGTYSTAEKEQLITLDD